MVQSMAVVMALSVALLSVRDICCTFAPLPMTTSEAHGYCPPDESEPHDMHMTLSPCCFQAQAEVQRWDGTLTARKLASPFPPSVITIPISVHVAADNSSVFRDTGPPLRQSRHFLLETTVLLI